MKKLLCSICGFEDNRKKFKNREINKHFEDAKEIWCPTNNCQNINKAKRIIPKGYVCNCWYEYGQWNTLEKKPKIIDIETIQSANRAKKILELGMKILGIISENPR